MQLTTNASSVTNACRNRFFFSPFRPATCNSVISPFCNDDPPLLVGPVTQIPDFSSFCFDYDSPRVPSLRSDRQDPALRTRIVLSRLTKLPISIVTSSFQPVILFLFLSQMISYCARRDSLKGFAKWTLMPINIPLSVARELCACSNMLRD